MAIIDKRKEAIYKDALGRKVKGGDSVLFAASMTEKRRHLPIRKGRIIKLDKHLAWIELINEKGVALKELPYGIPCRELLVITSNIYTNVDHLPANTTWECN